MRSKRFMCASVFVLLFGLSSFAQVGSSAEELVRAALQRNREYLAARERLNEAEALVRQAGLRPAPTIEVETASGAILGSRGESEYSAAYFHTLETSGKRNKRVAVAQKGLALVQAEVRERERQLRFDVKLRFIDAAERQLKLAGVRALAPITEENYRLTVRRVDLGDAAPLEQQLLLAEMNRSDAQQAMLSGSSEAAVVDLKTNVGLPADEELRISADFQFPRSAFTLAQLQRSALEQRGDLRMLALLEEQAAAETDLARAEGRPDVTASARYTRSRSSFDQSGLSDSGAIVPLRDTDNILTFGISIPLAKRNRNQAAADAAQSRQAQQRLRREHLERSIPLEVEAAYRRFTGALRSMEILRNGVIGPSQKNLTVIREAYRLGQLRLLEVLNEQRRLADLQLSYVEVQAEAARALAELERAVGGNLP